MELWHSKLSKRLQHSGCFGKPHTCVNAIVPFGTMRKNGTKIRKPKSFALVCLLVSFVLLAGLVGVAGFEGVASAAGGKAVLI